MKKSTLVIAFMISIILAVGYLGNEFIKEKEIEKIRNQLNNKEISLIEVYGGEWEVVCSSHPYDGPLYLKKYNKTYYPIASSQDGSWGLIFIGSDGNHKELKGSCKDGFNIIIGCLIKNKAALTVDRNKENCIILKEKS